MLKNEFPVQCICMHGPLLSLTDRPDTPQLGEAATATTDLWKGTSQLPLPNITDKGNVHHQLCYHTRRKLVLVAAIGGNK